MENKKNGLQAFGKGEIIFKQGEESFSMYDIRWGSVGVFANYGQKGEKQLATLRAGEFFGEMGMIEGCLRSATAVALENDTQVEVITPEYFDTYFKDKPAKVLMIMQNLSQRIRGLTKDYLDACRAVSEVEESRESGKEKSSWLKANVEKFVEDYHAGIQSLKE